MTTATTATTAQPVSTGSRPRPRILRSELLKILTTNSWWVFGILALAFTGLSLLAGIFQANSELDFAEQHKNDPPPQFGGDVPPDQGGMTAEDIARNEQYYRDSIDVAKIILRHAASIYTSGQFFGLLLMVILGAIIVTNEYLHQTATTTFLTIPRRTRVIFGKLAAAVVVAFAFWLLLTVVNVAVGSIFFASKGYAIPLADWPVLRSALFNLLAFVIWAVLGVGLGVLIRSQLGATLTGAAAYLVGYVAAFAVIGLIRQFIVKDDAVWSWIVVFPSVASQILVSPERLEIGNAAAPAWWVGGLVLVGYGLLAGLIGTLITRKRDIS